VGEPSGSEHNCRYLQGRGLFAKVTKSNRAGWRVDFEEMRLGTATPLQYLRRLSLVNFYFGDDIRFVGLEDGPDPYETRVSTTQPSLAPLVGKPVHPSTDVLKQSLESFGFEMLDPSSLQHLLGEAESIHFRRDNLWLFDVRPHNFVTDGRGRCIPIDVIVQCQDGDDIDDDFYGI